MILGDTANEVLAQVATLERYRQELLDIDSRTREIQKDLVELCVCAASDYSSGQMRKGIDESLTYAKCHGFMLLRRERGPLDVQADRPTDGSENTKGSQ